MHMTHTTSNASGLPIGQLGSTIKAHMGMAEKYIGKCEEHYRSAGAHLIEAKRRISENKEFAGDFKGFLMNCCNGLSSSRAYELIAIAGGKTTQEEHRQGARARDQAYRDRKAAAPRVRRPTENLKEARAAAQDETVTQQPAAADTAEQVLIKKIATACRGQPLEKLEALLKWAEAPPPPKLTPAQQDTAAHLTRNLLEMARRCTAEGIRDELKQALKDAAHAACPS